MKTGHKWFIGCTVAVAAIGWLSFEEIQCRSRPLTEGEALQFARAKILRLFSVTDLSDWVITIHRGRDDPKIWHADAKHQMCEVLVAVTQCEGVDVEGFSKDCPPLRK